MLRPLHGEQKSHMIFQSRRRLKGGFDKNERYFNCTLLGNVFGSANSVASRCLAIVPTNSAARTLAWGHIRQAAGPGPQQLRMGALGTAPPHSLEGGSPHCPALKLTGHSCMLAWPLWSIGNGPKSQTPSQLRNISLKFLIKKTKQNRGY